MAKECAVFGTLLLLQLCNFGLSVDNVITQWNAVTQQIVRSVGVPTQIAARVYSLVHISQYQALQLAYKLHNSYPDAAAAYAAHYVLSESFPIQQSQIFDKVIADYIFPLNLSKAEDSQIQNIARKYAVPLLLNRVNDGSQRWAKFEPAPPGGPTGVYQLTPNYTYVTFPQLAATRPFVIKSPASFDTFGGPYKIPSSGYDSDYDDVAKVGDASSPNHTRAQIDTAKFWEDAGNTSGLVGHLFNASLAIAGPSLSVNHTAYLFAKIAAAAYDGAIACWYQKYKYLFWRPITAFRQGDSCHKPAPDFTSTLLAPPEPEYPSGHATIAASWAAVVAQDFGLLLTDKAPNGPFVINTESYFLPPRTFNSIDAVAQQVALSRIYGGIHFPKAAVDGRKLGHHVGSYVGLHFRNIYRDIL